MGRQAQLLRRDRSSGARARTPPSTWPRAARSPSTAASSGASGRTSRATTASRSRSSPTTSSSSAVARKGGGGGGGGFTPRSDVPVDTNDFAAAPVGGGGARRRPRRRRTTTSRSRPSRRRPPLPALAAGPPATGPGRAFGSRLCHNELPRARCSRAHSVSRLQEDFTSGKAAQPAPVRRRDKRGGPGSGRRKPCPYCKDKIDQVDYKDIDGLRRFISEKGKMRSRRITGACRRHQSQIARAVKRARELALLPVRRRVLAAATTARAARRPRSRPRRPVAACPRSILLQDVENVGDQGHRRRRLQGLPAQLPRPAQARPAGDQGPARAGAPGRRGRGARPAAGRRGARARAPTS